ncbi:uncharacterized protein EDB91DRAFT_1086613 [Suillus paluster]|uniref:uncharacterized protein n=1 Tax=Suillus paluster TaxID=48578 RepID=UPI001B87633A|nr:uncharacterized protein EDB91DRAFT_1086613 [Suillus paluster]KAG1726871.1 hypothetical protein EDB91DRAFT_1086613 [Suillus paluster]
MCTNRLIKHLTECAILFLTESKKYTDCGADLGCPLSKDKGEIHSVIVKLIFHNDAVCASWYATNPVEFCDSMTNWIALIGYWKGHCLFLILCVGIVPINSEMSGNLHCKVEKEFPWYNNLYKIWGSNPC